jgi:predicted transcriptional regulator
MPHTTVRIAEATHAKLKELAGQRHTTMQVVLEEAIEGLRRRQFLDGVNRGYAALRADPEAWKVVEAERASWDATLADGLPEESWTERAESARPRPTRAKANGRSRSR